MGAHAENFYTTVGIFLVIGAEIAVLVTLGFAELGEWVRAGVRVYFFVHCPVEDHSPDNARLAQSMFEAGGAPVPPLPWNTLARPASQLRLF